MALFNRIVIVGMGLIGGSIGMAARERGLAQEVVGLIRNKNRRKAILKAKAADEVSTACSRALRGADLVVLGVPISAMEHCAKQIAQHIDPSAVVIDVGSVKGQVVEAMEKVFAHGGKFVGSHPMAGSEKSGVDAARADLFDKALCVVTPTGNTDPEALDRVGKFWEALGARTCLCSAQDHDRVIAAVSHLPHVLAAALMHLTLKVGEGFEDPIKFIGPAFKDMTRIAASPAELWADILLGNRSAVLRSTTLYVEKLEEIKEALLRRDRAELLAFFDRARLMREGI